jgi:nicotinamidase-related amidase
MRELTNAALRIIGMQQGSNDLRLGQRNNPQAEASILRLLQVWRAGQRSIVHVRHVSRSPESLYYPGKPDAEFQPEFVPHANEHVIEENVPDSFCNTGLEEWPRAPGVKQLVITGNLTNNSVEATARNAGNLGFAAFVPADATYTFDKTDFNGVRRRAEEVHAMSLANLQDGYATITTSDYLLGAA